MTEPQRELDDPKQTAAPRHRPTSIIIIHTKPVGDDVLGVPKNKGISLFHGGEKAKNDCWRVVEDVDPYSV